MSIQYDVKSIRAEPSACRLRACQAECRACTREDQPPHVALTAGLLQTVRQRDVTLNEMGIKEPKSSKVQDQMFRRAAQGRADRTAGSRAAALSERRPATEITVLQERERKG